MNKTMTLLILAAVLCAMGLIFYTNTQLLAPQPLPAPLNATDMPSVPQENATSGDPAGTPSTQAAPTPQESPQTTPRVQQQVPAAVSRQNAQQNKPAIPLRQAAEQSRQAPASSTPPDAAAAAGQASQAAASAAKTNGTVSEPAAANSSSSSAAAASAPPAARDEPFLQSTPRQSAAVQQNASSRTEPLPSAAPSGTVEAVVEDKAPEATPAPGKVTVAPEKLGLTGKHALTSIRLVPAGQDMLLRIEAGDPFPCKTFVLKEPDRLVIDLPGTWTGIKAPEVPENNLVQSARAGTQPAGPRLVLDLSRALKKYDVSRPAENVVEILLQ